MRSLVLFLALVYLISLTHAETSASTPGNHVICYYTYWSSGRNPPYDFKPEDIDAFLCTHIIYAFAIFGKNYDFDTTQGNFTELQPRLMTLKKRNPDLKIMFAAGGWKEGSTGFAEITKSEETRSIFSKNVVSFLRENDFDGIDLNWQHPTVREGGKPEDRENYVYLAQNLRDEFDKEAVLSGRAPLLLAISITQLKKALPAYDIRNFNNYMDFISVLCYDYQFSFTTVVKHHAPLYATSDDEDDKELNIDYTINYFLEQAAPEKLVLGIPTYGRTKRLIDPEDTDLGAEADGAGDKGPFTGEDGFFSYFEICSKIKNENWTVAHSKPYGSVGPHAYKGNQWVGYDDPNMVRTKARYAKQKGLAGVVFWTIDYDDFLGSCGNNRYPLINAAKEELNMIPSREESVMVFPEEPKRRTSKPVARQKPTRVVTAKKLQTEPSTKSPAATSTPPSTTSYRPAAQTPTSTPGNQVICYYTYWSSGRNPPYDFKPEDIDAFLCTHIIYAFAIFGKNYDFDTTQGNFTELQPRLMTLKKRNPDLKIMFAAGGWKEGSTGFAEITKSEETRSIFSKNVVSFLRENDFDGIDLNWQHPTVREGGKPEDRENYVFLAQNLRDEFDKEAVVSGRAPLLLAISITQLKKALPAYDIRNFNNYMDFISVLCYDYQFSFTTVVKHHAPLYATSDDEDDKELNIDYTINYFLEQAAPEKLVLGIPTYGRTKRLIDPEDTDLGAEADGAGDKGPFTGEDGFFSYFEICSKIKNENWTVAHSKPHGSVGPHAYKGNQWVGYDDPNMVRTKARYAKQKGLAGVVFWTIDYDDFLGSCGNNRYPLINAAKEELNMIPSREESVMVFPEEPTRRTSKPVARPKPTRVVTTKKLQTEPPTKSPTTTSTPPATTRYRPAAPLVDVSPPSVDPPIRSRAHGQRDDQPDENDLQPDLVVELLQLIEKAGGMKNFCKTLREAKNIYKRTRGTSFSARRYDDMIVDVPSLEPLRLLITNSSITIQELNIYGKP